MSAPTPDQDVTLRIHAILTVVEGPGTTPLGAPGSVARRAQDLGLEWEKTEKERDDLRAKLAAATEENAGLAEALKNVSAAYHYGDDADLIIELRAVRALLGKASLPLPKFVAERIDLKAKLAAATASEQAMAGRLARLWALFLKSLPINCSKCGKDIRPGKEGHHPECRLGIEIVSLRSHEDSAPQIAQADVDQIFADRDAERLKEENEDSEGTGRT